MLLGLSGVAQDSTQFALDVQRELEEVQSAKIPINLDAFINEEGSVYLHWDCLAHDSILGYKIFYSTSERPKYSEFINGIISDTDVEKQIDQGDKTITYFFKVTSVDSTLTQSKFSDVVKIQTYDIIPPVKPELSSLDVLKDGLFIRWNKSTSNDVAKYILNRTDNIDKNSVQIEIADNSISDYLDQDIERGRWYTYNIVAIDDDGNISDASREMKVFAEDMSPKNGAQNLQISSLDGENLGIKVTWEVENSTVFKYEVYKSVNGKGYELYAKLLADGTYEFIDYKVKKKKTYGYQIRAIYTDGTLSPLSDEIIIGL